MSISNDQALKEFKKGNYLAVALSGGESDWQTHAARGLIALDASDGERLSEFDGEEASFYRAVLHWMDGNEKLAIPILEQSSLPAAHRLLNILAAPKLRVISQMLEGAPSPFSLFRGASCDERFELTNIDFRAPSHGSGSTPSSDVTDHLDSSDPPVFFISTMVEWNPLPDKLEHLSCPVFGHVVDYDMAFQTLLPSLQRFDEIIVAGEKEKSAIERLTCRPATVYPHYSALDDSDLPELSQLTTDKVDIDVIMTGTTIDYFHPDKREFLKRILKCRDVDPLIVHGFLPKKFYFQVYRRARIVTSFNRWLNDETFGQHESRSLEALAVGRPIFSRRGSVLAHFASDKNEIFEFRMESALLEPSLARAVNREKLEPLDRKSTAKKFRQLYGHQNVGSRYLRFLTFRAAMNERGIQPAPQGPPIYQRVTGWTGFPKIPVDLHEKTMSILSERCLNVDDWQSRLIAARELILSAAEAGRTKSGDHYVPETLNRYGGKFVLLQHGSNLLREIIETSPYVLAARFNLIRALLHLGDESDRIEALNLLNETLAGSMDQWELDQFDHVMPFDFFPHMFDYRNYLESLTYLGGGIEEQNRRKRMVLASLNAYLGWFDGNAKHFHEAKRLNPDFINYRLWSARADVTKGDWSNVEDLKADLETASFDPLTCQQATQILWTFREKIYENGVVPQEIEDFANRNEQCVLYGAESEGGIGSIYNAGWHLPGNVFNNQHTAARSGLDNGNTVLTVIIAPRPRRNYRALLDSLAVQTLSKNRYSVVWTDPFGVLPHDQPDIVDENVCCGQMGVFDHLNRCYNLALSRVISPVVLIIDQTAPLPDNFLTMIVETFINGPEGPLVVATGDSGSKSSILENLRLYQESTIAFRTEDLVSVGGFDEAPSFYGLLSGPFDAAHRIALQPGAFATINTGIRETNNRRCRHAFVAEYFESLYDFERTLPHVEQEDIRKLRKQKQN